MHTLSLADFSDLAKHSFPVVAGGARLMLTLTAATAVQGGRPGGREPFSLTFLGPTQPLLPQAMYEFEHPRHGRLAIFIVPIGAGAEGVTYEAVFG